MAQPYGKRTCVRGATSLRLGNSALFVAVLERDAAAWCLLATNFDVFVHPLLESFDLAVVNRATTRPQENEDGMGQADAPSNNVASRTCSWSLLPSPADISCDSPILAMRPLLESFELGPSV